MPCDFTKEFLSSRGVEFELKDVRQDAAALQELLEMGARATPVTRVGGEIVIGYDLDRLKELLEQS